MDKEKPRRSQHNEPQNRPVNPPPSTGMMFQSMCYHVFEVVNTQNSSNTSSLCSWTIEWRRQRNQQDFEHRNNHPILVASQNKPKYVAQFPIWHQELWVIGWRHSYRYLIIQDKRQFLTNEWFPIPMWSAARIFDGWVLRSFIFYFLY